MVTCLVRDRVLLFSVVLILLFVVGLFKPVSAAPTPATTLVTVSLSANPSSITVTAGSSNSTTITITVSFPAPLIPDGIGSVLNPMISCSGLPAGATCATNPSPLPIPLHNGQQFTLTVSVPASTAPGTYQVTVQISFQSTTPPPGLIQPGFLAMSPTNGGGIGLGSISIQQLLPTASVPITVIVTPATQPAVHPLNVGGEMLPMNLLQVLAPWVAAVLALTVVAVATLVVRKKRNPSL